MKRIVISGVTCMLLAVHAPAQVSVGGSAAPAGGGTASSAFLHGTDDPASIVGSAGDFYLNTRTNCLYGPKTSDGWPSPCVSLIGPPGPGGSDLGYTAEDVSHKGAANGYAPLNASSQIPLANLPVVPYSQTTGVQPHSALLDLFAGVTADGLLTMSGGSPVSGALTGDVRTDGLTATVTSVGGSSAANIHNAEVQVNSATSNSAASTLVKRDNFGNISVAQVYSAGTALENSANKGLANGYAPLNASAQVPLTYLPPIPYSQTSGVQQALGYAPENAANKAQANGYASLDANAMVPASQIPFTALPSVATAGDVNPGGNLNATGNVSAGTATSAPGCVHLSDANGAHDMGICAPNSGFNGMLNLPVAAGSTGAVLSSDGAGGLSWLKSIRGSSSAPSVACGPGAGSGCNASVNGNNNSGKIALTMGTVPTSASAVVTVTFSGTVLPPGGCVIGPAMGGTSTLGAATAPYLSSVTATGFVISSSGTALGAGPYSWWYVCI